MTDVSPSCTKLSPVLGLKLERAERSTHPNAPPSFLLPLSWSSQTHSPKRENTSVNLTLFMGEGAGVYHRGQTL